MQSDEPQHTEIQPAKRGRGRPRKLVLGDDRQEWLKPASAARLLDLAPSSFHDMLRGRAPVRVPLEVRHLPNGLPRVSRASVLAQLACVMLALAVEQSGAGIVSPALRHPAGMGSAEGKVLAIGAEWDRFAGSVGDMPTGQRTPCLGRGDGWTISPVISPDSGLDSSAFNQGGRGSDLLRAGGWADGFGQGENFHIASESRG